MEQRLEKTIQAIRASGADWALLASPDGVAYATGHVVPIEAGPSPFAGGPSLAIIGTNGASGLVVTNLEGGNGGWAQEVITYEGFYFKERTDVGANYLAAAHALARRMGLGGTVAIEDHAFPYSLVPLVHDLKRVSIEPAFRLERAIKTPEEIEFLREAALTASAGQRAFVEATRAGRTELEIFADIRLAMESRAGERLPLTGDFISGRERTSAFMGWPGNRRVEIGDPLISDLAPRVRGYWGDSCASSMLSEPSKGFLRLYGTAKSALSKAVEIVRPGLVVADLDRALQEIVAGGGYSYAHHSGHSIGAGVHEWPRLTAYETAPLEENMVIMVEPTALDPEVGGVRVEWMLRVTADGCEVMTDFEHQPGIPV